MNIQIAKLEVSTEERLYGTLIEDIEKIGYLVIQDEVLRNKL